MDTKTCLALDITIDYGDASSDRATSNHFNVTKVEF